MITDEENSDQSSSVAQGGGGGSSDRAVMDLDVMSSAYATLITNAVPPAYQESQRQGLEKTPMRAAKAMQFFTKGYNETLAGR